LVDLDTPVKFTEADKIGGVAEVRRLPFTSPAVCGESAGLPPYRFPARTWRRSPRCPCAREPVAHRSAWASWCRYACDL